MRFSDATTKPRNHENHEKPRKTTKNHEKPRDSLPLGLQRAARTSAIAFLQKELSNFEEFCGMA
jgi:hypothetical protein